MDCARVFVVTVTAVYRMDAVIIYHSISPLSGTN
jgi:hypothetical protein